MLAFLSIATLPVGPFIVGDDLDGQGGFPRIYRLDVSAGASQPRAKPAAWMIDQGNYAYVGGCLNNMTGEVYLLGVNNLFSDCRLLTLDVATLTVTHTASTALPGPDLLISNFHCDARAAAMVVPMATTSFTHFQWAAISADTGDVDLFASYTSADALLPGVGDDAYDGRSQTYFQPLRPLTSLLGDSDAKAEQLMLAAHLVSSNVSLHRQPMPKGKQLRHTVHTQRQGANPTPPGAAGGTLYGLGLDPMGGVADWCRRGDRHPSLLQPPREVCARALARAAPPDDSAVLLQWKVDEDKLSAVGGTFAAPDLYMGMAAVTPDGASLVAPTVADDNGLSSIVSVPLGGGAPTTSQPVPGWNAMGAGRPGPYQWASWLPETGR